jgi:hypothetical protein
MVKDVMTKGWGKILCAWKINLWIAPELLKNWVVNLLFI